MDSFIGTTVGLTASMLMIVGSGTIVLISIAMACTIHWAFVFGVFLFPAWAAAMIQVIDWSFDL